MKITLEQVHRHRNGICGSPFDVIVFRDLDEGRMLAIVFDTEHDVAVFNLDKLLRGDIAFGSNSWRGDHYEPRLRKALADWQGSDCGKEV